MNDSPRPIPDAETLADWPPFERLGLDQIELVHDQRGAERAANTLAKHPAWGFDTESKPTFLKEQVSDGPHTVQLASQDQAWVFQLHNPGCCAVLRELLRLPIDKAGFGLGDDQRRVRRKLEVELIQLIELNTVFRQRGYRKDMGVKAAVAVLFERRFIKSKKAATSNWANPQLSPGQLVYAANDAWAALRVYHALGLGGASASSTSKPSALAPPSRPF